MLGKTAKFIKNEVLYNGHLQSLSAVAVVFISTVFITQRSSSAISLLLVYLTFQFIFIYDRYLCLENDLVSNPERTKHLERYKRFVPAILFFLIILITIFSMLFTNGKVVLFIATITLFGVAYSLKIKSLTKKFFLLKNVYVSLVYAGLVFFPVLFYSSGIDQIRVVVFLFIFVFFESAVSQMALDIKDVIADAKLKLLTLPLIIGRARSLNFLWYTSVLFGTVFSLFAIYLRLDSLFVLAIFNILINLVLLNRIKSRRSLGYLIAASKFNIWWLVVLFTRMVV